MSQSTSSPTSAGSPAAANAADTRLDGGWLVIARTKFDKMPFLAALKEVKLRTFVTPGQKLEVSAKIAHEGSGFAMTEAQIKADGKIICDADITFRVVDFPEGDFRANMDEVARRIGFPRESVAHG